MKNDRDSRLASLAASWIGLVIRHANATSSPEAVAEAKRLHDTERLYPRLPRTCFCHWKNPIDRMLTNQKGNTMNLQMLDQAPAVAALLKREAGLNATLQQLRQPVAIVPDDDLKREARRLLGDAAEPAAMTHEERARQVKITELALADLRGRIQEARTKARREIVSTLKLADRAATMRQGLADAASRLLHLMAEAEEFGKELAFSEIAVPETWPGDRPTLAASIAFYALALEEAGAHVSDVDNLMRLSGKKPEPDRWALVHTQRPPAAESHYFDDGRILE